MTGETPAVHEALAVYAPETTETDRVPEGYKLTEVGVIPEDWKTASLEELSFFITKGSTPTTYGFGWVTEGILFLRSECVSQNGLDLTQSMFISAEAHTVLRRSEVHEGDLLITITGNVGRVVRLTDLTGSANINQHIARIRVVPSEAHAGFVFHFLSQPKVRRYYGSITTGQAYPQISLQQVRETKIHLPSLHEQRAIAAALSDVDALISALDNLISKKRAVKTAAMQQLLTGKQRLPEFSGEWEVKQLGDYAEINSGGTPSSNVPHYYDGSIPWVSITDMTKRGKYIVSTDRKLTEKGLASSAARMFPKGTVLYAMYASIGECSIADVDLCSSQAILGIRPGGFLNNLYLYFVLVSKKETVKTLGQQGTQANLNAGIVKNFLIPIPSPEEQTAIATVLSDMDAEIEALEARREKTRQVKRGMMQELLTGRTRLDHEGVSS